MVAILSDRPLAFVLACITQMSTGVCCIPRCRGAISRTLCRDYRALEESAQLSIANMKALRLRDESGLPGLRRCATQMLITKQYLALGQEKGGGWEGLLHEALVVGALALHVAHVCVLWVMLSEGTLLLRAVTAVHTMNPHHALCVALCLSIFGAQVLCYFWLLTVGDHTIWFKITPCAVC